MKAFNLLLNSLSHADWYSTCIEYDASVDNRNNNRNKLFDISSFKGSISHSWSCCTAFIFDKGNAAFILLYVSLATCSPASSPSFLCHAIFPGLKNKGITACFCICRSGKQRLRYFPALLIYILLLTHWSTIQKKKKKKNFTSVWSWKKESLQSSQHVQIQSTIVGSSSPPLLSSLRMLTFFVWFSPTSLQLPVSRFLSASFLISHQKMQAVYLCVAEGTPLSSPTRWFIPKRDLFSKINGESKGLPKGYLPWHEVIASQNYPNKNHCAL